MVTTQETAWDDITNRLDELSDKQLGNLITVIRAVQVEREEATVS
jgi:hypothetical protein